MTGHIQAASIHGMAGRPRLQRGPRPAIAYRLQAARTARGISQVTAASELGIQPSVLGAIESGARRPSALARRYLEVWAAACLGEPLNIIPTENAR